MTSPSGRDASSYCADGEWGDESQALNRQLMDSRVVGEQLDEGRTNQNPRYPPAGRVLPPRQDDREHTTTGNYGFGTAGSTGFLQEGSGQQEGVALPDFYAPLRPASPSSGYANPSPSYTNPSLSYANPSSGYANVSPGYANPSPSYANPSPGYANPSISYANPATLYGGQTRYGFSPTQYAQSGLGDPYRASHLGSTASGYQRGVQRYPTSLPHFTPQTSPGQNLWSGYPDHYSPTGEQIPDTPPPYHQEPSWSTGDNRYYQYHTNPIRSTISQQRNRALTGQNVLSQFPEPCLIPQTSVTPSRLEVHSAIPPQDSNIEALSPSNPDETSDSQTAIQGGRQSQYSDSHETRPDSITIGSKSGRQKSYHSDPESDATVEITSSGSASQRRRHQITYTQKGRTNDGTKASRSHSRPPVTGMELSRLGDVESVDTTAENLREISLHGLNSVDQQSIEPYEGDARIPPRGSNTPGDDNPAPASKDSMKTTNSRRRGSTTRHGHRPTSSFQRRNSQNLREKSSGNKVPIRLCDPELDENIKLRPSHEFKKGRVLITLWCEPCGKDTHSTRDGEMGSTEPAGYGEMSYNSFRRFVIFKKIDGHCLCVPILTYGGKATTKPGVKADHHAIIYVGDSEPKELENEEKLVKKPIRMVPFSEKYKLDPASRVNYTKLYTIEHNIKVNIIGKIHDDSKVNFFTNVKIYLDDSDGGEVEGKKEKGRGR